MANPAAIVTVSHEKSVDIDEPIDWILAESVGSLHGFPLKLKGADGSPARVVLREPND